MFELNKSYTFEVKEDLNMKNTDLVTKYLLPEIGIDPSMVHQAQRGNVIFVLTQDNADAQLVTLVCSRPKKQWSVQVIGPEESIEKGFTNIPGKLKKAMMSAYQDKLDETYVNWFGASDKQATDYAADLVGRRNKFLELIKDVVGMAAEDIETQYYIRLTPRGISLKSIPNKGAEFESIYVTNDGKIETK